MLHRLLFQILAWLLAGIFLFSAAYAQPLEKNTALTLTAPSYILIEAGTGTVIFGKNTDEKRQTASLTKLMSVLLFMEALESGAVSLETQVSVSAKAAATKGSTALLDANSTYRFEDLLRACIVASGNDACVAMAEYISGSEEAFVERMNHRAQELSLKNTSFCNCTGLSDENQSTTASDLAIIASELSKHPLFFNYSTLWLSNIVHPSGRRTDLTNTNRLIRFYAGCDGMKTGSSSEAKYCICATASKDGMRLIAIVLGASGSQLRFDEARSMLEYGLNNYKRSQIIASGELTGYNVRVERGARESVPIAAGKGLSMLLKTGQEKQLSIELSLPESVTAPLLKGEPIGSIHVYLDSRQIATLPAILAEDVRLPGYIEGFLRIIKAWH